MRQAELETMTRPVVSNTSLTLCLSSVNLETIQEGSNVTVDVLLRPVPLGHLFDNYFSKKRKELVWIVNEWLVALLS